MYDYIRSLLSFVFSGMEPIYIGELETRRHDGHDMTTASRYSRYQGTGLQGPESSLELECGWAAVLYRENDDGNQPLMQPDSRKSYK